MSFGDAADVAARFHCEDSPPVPGMQHVFGVAAGTLAVLLLDLPLRRALHDADSSTRWFALHSIVNLIITAACLGDVRTVLVTPLCTMLNPTASWVPAYLAFSLHVYHLFAFTKLRSEDIFHHVVFVGTFALLNFTPSLAWGPLVNVLLFFMTGLPGAIDYALCCAVKLSKLDKLAEKNANCWINAYLRMPGLASVAALVWVCTMVGATRVPPLASVLVWILAFGNGTYYGEQVIGNYHACAARDRERAKSARRS